LKPVLQLPRFEGAKPKGLRHTNLVRGSAGKVVAGVPWAFAFVDHFPPGKTAVVPTVTTIQLPIPWETFGFAARFQTRSTCLVDGSPAWAWDSDAPDLGIPEAEAASGEPCDGWDLDHVVLLVPNMADALATMAETLGAPRLLTKVNRRPTAFFRVGPLLEVIESPVRAPALYGVALVTTESLEAVVLNWRSRGLDMTDPKPAIQSDRRIFTVRGTAAGLAVMSPDGPGNKRT
jgi:hypothetical protein